MSDSGEQADEQLRRAALTSAPTSGGSGEPADEQLRRASRRAPSSGSDKRADEQLQTSMLACTPTNGSDERAGERANEQASVRGFFFSKSDGYMCMYPTLRR
ncbi:hypothetical protein ZWY2020_051761 [Hordeum vulgare]|nr:hypothetical protein ZWY2020_051761 [Hordeum vulgare]